MNDAQLRAAVDAVTRVVPADAILGIYLYGSAVSGGLRPDSDLDLAVLTSRRLAPGEKDRLVDGLHPLSRRSLRPAGWRPLEVTVLAQPDVRPWRYPPRFDLQYGEWLSDDQLSDQVRRGPTKSPDLAVAITLLREASRPLEGPPAADVLDPVPRADLVRAMLDEIPSLLGDLEDDTRNVLLTLARMWSTVATGAVSSKDDAAEWAVAELPAEQRPPLIHARSLYRDGGWGEWDGMTAEVRGLAQRMADEIRRAAAR